MNPKIEARIADAKTECKFTGSQGTVSQARELYLAASSGFVVSRGFYFDLALACMKEAGFVIEERK